MTNNYKDLLWLIAIILCVFIIATISEGQTYTPSMPPTVYVPPPTPPKQGRPPFIGCWETDTEFTNTICCYEWRGSNSPGMDPGYWQFLQCVR